MEKDISPEIFGERVKGLREKRNMLANIIAKSLGVSHTTVSQWESGKQYPTVKKLIELAQFFNVPAGFLLGLED